MKEELDILVNIEKVESPHFLYSKIIEKIKQKEYKKISYKEALTLSLTCLFILIINISIVKIVLKKDKSHEAETLEIARGMQIIKDHNLY